MQRRPPRYTVDRAGTVRPASNETAPQLPISRTLRQRRTHQNARKDHLRQNAGPMAARPRSYRRICVRSVASVTRGTT